LRNKKDFGTTVLQKRYTITHTAPCRRLKNLYKGLLSLCIFKQFICHCVTGCFDGYIQVIPQKPFGNVNFTDSSAWAQKRVG